MNVKAYGLWDSPISAEKTVANSVSYQDIQADGEKLYWLESRPSEKGRNVVVQMMKDGTKKDLLGLSSNARSRVHEYGGTCFTVKDGTLYFVEFSDQRVYELKPDLPARPITPEGIRFAELFVCKHGLLAIGEQHFEQGEPQNGIYLLNLESDELKVLESGNDFYSSIALSPDESSIAWISWNHPNMPWDNTQLWTASLQNGELTNRVQIDALHSDQSFFQPQFNHKNKLFVISDKSNWWNLYQVIDLKLEPVFETQAELGKPLWSLGTKTYAFDGDAIVCSFSEAGVGRLWRWNQGNLQAFDLPYQSFSQSLFIKDSVVSIVGAPNLPQAIIQIERNGSWKLLAESMSLDLSADLLSTPKHFHFKSTDGEAYAYLYLPENPDFKAPPNTLPPLIVKSHGGPTGSADSNLNLEIHYWTSRGFALVDVNYRGSTGYGRAYRHALNEQWGILDVADCEAAALYLVEKGLVDKQKLAITGRSAGGYTTLATLAFCNSFHVGASLYGVSDLEALALDTHKFEAHYLDTLIGPYPAMKKRYTERSPINHIDKLSAPIIFFQGAQDKVVPPNQAETMVEALNTKGIPNQYILFPNEQHGFRDAANKIQVLELQYQFFIKELGIGESSS